MKNTIGMLAVCKKLVLCLCLKLGSHQCVAFRHRIHNLPAIFKGAEICVINMCYQYVLSLYMFNLLTVNRLKNRNYSKVVHYLKSRLN